MKVTITPERAWTIAAIAAVGALLGIALFDLFLPKPAMARSAKQRLVEQQRLEKQLVVTRANAEAAAISIDKLVWRENPDAIGPAALSQITAFARARGVRLVSFRPQQAQEDGELVRHPYLITLEGSFLNVMSFLKDVQTPTTRLAVHMVQMTSSDGKSDVVSANIGVTAYRQVKESNATQKKN